MTSSDDGQRLAMARCGGEPEATSVQGSMKRTACAWVAMAGLLLAGCGSSSNGRAPGGSGGQIGNAGSGGSAGQGGAGAAGSAGQGGSGGQTAACTGGQTACGTACVDLQTDAANCGACGHDCLGGSCKAGLCSPMPVGPDGVEALVVDGGSVYFMSATNGQTLNRFSLNDNSLAQLASGFSNLEDLRVRGGNVYWAGYNETTQHDEFFSVPTTGGTVKSVQQNADMYGVDFLGDSAYSVSDCSNIYRVSLLDGSDTVINQDGCNVFGGVYSVQIDQSRSVWLHVVRRAGRQHRAVEGRSRLGSAHSARQRPRSEPVAAAR